MRCLHRVAQLARGRLLPAFWCAVALAAPARTVAAERAALESAIVFNLLQFIEWPGEANLAPGSPMVLCMESKSPVLSAARQLEGRPIRQMKLHVQAFEGSSHQCQVIYLDSASAEVQSRGAAAHDAVLTIGASDFHPRELPVIQLVAVDGRLAFDISQRQAAQLGLTVSSRLLRLARASTS